MRTFVPVLTENEKFHRFHSWRLDSQIPVIEKLQVMSVIELGGFVSTGTRAFAEEYFKLEWEQDKLDKRRKKHLVDSRNILERIVQAANQSQVSLDHLYDRYLLQVSEEQKFINDLRAQWVETNNNIHITFSTIKRFPIMFLEEKKPTVFYDAVYIPPNRRKWINKVGHAVQSDVILSKKRSTFGFVVPLLNVSFSLILVNKLQQHQKELYFQVKTPQEGYNISFRHKSWQRTSIQDFYPLKEATENCLSVLKMYIAVQDLIDLVIQYLPRQEWMNSTVCIEKDLDLPQESVRKRHKI